MPTAVDRRPAPAPSTSLPGLVWDQRRRRSWRANPPDPPGPALARFSLHAGKTELAQALAGLADSLASFGVAAGPKPNLEEMCLELVLAADRLQSALADPVKAL